MAKIMNNLEILKPRFYLKLAPESCATVLKMQFRYKIFPRLFGFGGQNV